jgi:cyclophilin family peptidyl-prolyl cis-trans isomerase
MVFQLFQSTMVNGKTIPLAVNTVKHIEEFTNDHYYTSPTTDGLSPTKLFTRIVNLSFSASEFIAQGGEPRSIGTGGTSGQPNTPFPNEEFQQLAFTGTHQLAIANAGVTTTGTNDTQFFITTSNLNSLLGYNFPIFGQMVSGQSILSKMIAVPTSGSFPTNGQPLHNVSITGVSLSSTNPNGVALIDTTQAKPGESAVFQVTATDPKDGTTVRHDFVVTVGAYSGPTDPIINYKPFAKPSRVSALQGRETTVTLDGQNAYPGTGAHEQLTYSLVTRPAHGKITHFNASTGTLEYKPNPGFTGSDSFEFVVHETGPEGALGSGTTGPLGTTSSNPAVVTMSVTRRGHK